MTEFVQCGRPRPVVAFGESRGSVKANTAAPQEHETEDEKDAESVASRRSATRRAALAVGERPAYATVLTVSRAEHP